MKTKKKQGKNAKSTISKSPQKRMGRTNPKQLEVRGFLKLDAFLRKKYGTMPVYYDIDGPLTGVELANAMSVPLEDIEVIFINGFVYATDEMINPGDRVAFLPPGCPGPYRIALGFYGKNQDNEANFKILNKDHKKIEDET